MRHFMVVAALAAGLAAASTDADAQISRVAPAPATAAAPPDVAATRAELARAMRAIQTDDINSELSTLAAVIGSPAFSQLTSSERHSAYLVAGLADLQTGESAAAQPLLKSASVMPEALSIDWQGRLMAAADNDDVGDAVFSLTSLARRFPTSVNQVEDGVVLRVADQAGSLPQGATWRFDLLSALYDAHWSPSDPLTDASGAWRDLARGLLAAGDGPRAAAVAGRVVDPAVIAEMKAEKVFDPITRADPDHFNPQAAATRRIQVLRAEAEAAPDRLAAQNAVANALTAAGRDDEALRTLDRAMARGAPADGGASSFTDVKDQLAWTRYLRAYALAHLDRHDEAIDQMLRLTRSPDHVLLGPLDSIGLARMYALVGRATDALDVLAQVPPGDVSGFDRVQLELTRAVASAQLKDPPGAGRALAQARPYAPDAPGAFASLLLVQGDLDGAAALYVRRLADPMTRPDALLELQDWRIPPGNTPIEREVERRLKQLRARPDVQAAVTAVGRIGSYDLNGPTF